MNEGLSMSDEVVSPALVQCLDRVCDRFEAAWKEGQRPEVEDYIDGVPESERSLLLRELIAVDLHYRRASGETIPLSEYHRRFPADAGMIATLFQDGNVLMAAPPEPVPGGKSRDPVRLGRYRITGRIGSGSFGVVYQGRDDEL